MSCDMYVYRTHHLSDEEIEMIKSLDLENNYYNYCLPENYCAFPVCGPSNEVDKYRNLLEFGYETTSKFKVINYNQIKEDYNINVKGIKSIIGNIYVFNATGLPGDELRISMETMDELYREDVYITVAIVYLEEKLYYKNQNAIREYLSSKYDFGNCWYIKITLDDIDEMEKLDPYNNYDFRVRNNEALFYHEWY